MCRPRVEEGGRTDAVNTVRRRHMARGAETSGGGWRVVGVGYGQVENAQLRERRWGAGAHIDVTTMNG